ncbi:unnamed protein product [Prorocentrum cordatum]|uniref:COP9 signalosome complex subunit 3 n=1 Tax=Prorocentrum cordatum TaxID=2364126 RepID=A0ABN9SM56_9DINO|nr:unnamed protein product [Polarella glacialis]
MELVISQIHTLSTRNDGDLKKLKDFLRHEAESLKTNAHHIDQALDTLDPASHTLGIAFLLAAQLGAAVFADKRKTLVYVGNFLKAADEQQLKKASQPVSTLCRSYAQMAIEDGQAAMVQAVLPLRCAVEKLRPSAETLTPVHADFLRVCLKAKAYPFASPVLDQPIYDISMSNGSSSQMTPQSFLCYFYYGALLRIGMKEYQLALQMLLVVLTCPASCLSAIQADAYKKYVLVSLKAHGESQALPVYASHIVQRYAAINGYVQDLAEAFKAGDTAAMNRVAEEKAAQIQADQNTGLVKQVVASLQRHKVQLLTKTYLTLSLAEIAKELGIEESKTAEVEELLFDMISNGEINARIDQITGNVSFEDDSEDMDSAMMEKMQDKLARILELASRLASFEHEVASSEAYIRKVATLEADLPPRSRSRPLAVRRQPRRAVRSTAAAPRCSRAPLLSG